MGLGLNRFIMIYLIIKEFYRFALINKLDAYKATFII